MIGTRSNVIGTRSNDSAFVFKVCNGESVKLKDFNLSQVSQSEKNLCFNLKQIQLNFPLIAIPNLAHKNVASSSSFNSYHLFYLKLF